MMTPELQSKYIKYGSITLVIGVAAYIVYKMDLFKKVGLNISPGVKHKLTGVMHGRFNGKNEPSKVAVYPTPRQPLEKWNSEIDEPYLMMALGTDSKNNNAPILGDADFLKIKGTGTQLDGNHLIGAKWADDNGDIGAFWIDIPGFTGPGKAKGAGGTGKSTAYNGTMQLMKGKSKTNRKG